MSERARNALPVVVVVAVLIALWYLAAFLTAGVSERAIVPAPHEVALALAAGIFGEPPTSPRSLVYHAAVTAETAVTGFALAFVIGIVLAVGIVHRRTLDRSLMPWIIASQTVPVLAIAPMVVVVLGNAGVSGLVPKALIAAYLSFFPIATSMVAGLRAPDPMQFDLMRTYSARGWDVFAKLRWPASMDFLFVGMKIAATLSVVGAIVAELPTGAQAGLGSRLLAGSYYGQTLTIWSALFMAALLSIVAISATDLAQRLLLRSRGGRR
jgi:NitT/TauT family transport system permease protein